MKNILKQCAFIALITTVLSACSGLTHRHNPNALSLTASTYIQMADTAQGEVRQNYLLLAARRFIQDGDAYGAQHTLNRLHAPLTPTQKVDRQLTQAQVYFLRNQNDGAILLLNRVASHAADALTQHQKIRLYQLLATLYDREENLIRSIRARSTLDPLLPDSTLQKKNRLAIWQSLQPLDQTQLNTLYSQTEDPSIRGWITLASVIKTAASPGALADNLARWRQEYSWHIATSLLPRHLHRDAIQPQYHAQQIALLVPLSGNFAQQGSAIRNGFFAAYYQHKKEKLAPNIRVYNTNEGTIEAIYTKAIQHGANIVVGPLLKSHIQTLVDHRVLSVPTLALNTITWGGRTPDAHLFQFGLSPLDETAQVAQKAWERGLSRLLVLAPNNNWGQQLADFFRRQWEALGGQIVDQLNYTKQPKLAKEIRNILHIDTASQDYHDLKKLVKEKIRFIPRRRKDIDGIFLIAQPKAARQIKPLLAYYYANDIPVFSVSNIYSGTINTRKDRDLNGIIFCGMPWIIAPQTMTPHLRQIRAHLKSTWPQSFARQAKLYGLGVDAYHISSTLNKLLLLPHFGIPSATGVITLTPSQHIFRALPWAQFVKGKPQWQQRPSS